MDYQKINEETINRWITEEDWEWGRPISHEVFMDAKNGKWDVGLTPTKPVPHSWLGELKGKKILGLASGGGQQMPIFTALGAKCTVMDISDVQLESEKLVADREKYDIEIVKGDMTKRFPFNDEEFDIIFSPVSYCYVEKLEPIFKECYRVLKKGGTYMFGCDNGINYLTNDEETIENKMPFNPLLNKDQMDALIEDDCGVQFSHSFEEIIGGVLHAGFRVKDVYEDTNGEGRLHELNIPTYISMLMEK